MVKFYLVPGVRKQKFYLVPGVRNQKFYFVSNDSYEKFYLAVKGLIYELFDRHTNPCNAIGHTVQERPDNFHLYTKRWSGTTVAGHGCSIGELGTLTDLNNMAFLMMIKLFQRIVKSPTISDVKWLKLILKLDDSDPQMFIDNVATVKTLKTQLSYLKIDINVVSKHV